MTILATLQIGSYLKGASSLTKHSRFASYLLIITLWG